MKMTLCTSDCIGVPGNCSYPRQVLVTCAGELREAVRTDHVCAIYRNDYRAIENFIRSDCLVMDIDNDHSEDPAQWLTEEKLEEIFEDIHYALTTSRHHMISKEGKAPRPKYHIYFPITLCTDADLYGKMKRALHRTYPFFDRQARDAARFIYGSKCKEPVWHEGIMTIDAEIEILPEDGETDSEEASGEGYAGTIPQGSRNNTMSRFAARVLKRYGVTEKAREAFLEHARKCAPPLPEKELSTIWASAVRFFNKKVATSEGYVPPEEYNDDFGKASLKPGDYSDIGEAKILAREYGGELRYSVATDYLRYDGDCWRENKPLAIGAVEELMDLQLEDAKDAVQNAVQALVGAGINEELVRNGGSALERSLTPRTMPLYFALLGAQSYMKFIMKRRDYKYIVSTLNTAKPMLAIEVSSLDRDPNYLNTPSGTYDLAKGLSGSHPHDPSDLITRMTACSPGEEGKKIWEDALDLFFCGDRELIGYVQETVGMAAIGKVYQEHMIIAYGGGANGKSTFWNTIFRVMGGYAGKISAEALSQGCRRNVKPEMAELKGKRLIIASEMDEGMRLNTAVVKQLCSTDEIEAEKKYKDPFHFVPSHTLVLYTNYLPKVGANDDGIWRRLIVIPFNAKITGAGDIKNYADYLFEKAGPAVMTWIIEGAQRAISHQFHTKVPAVVEEAVEAYREGNDWLGQFIDDACDEGPDLWEKSGELYQAYRAYCMQNGEHIRSTTDFYSSLDKAGFKRFRQSTGVKVKGLKLKTGQDFLD